MALYRASGVDRVARHPTLRLLCTFVLGRAAASTQTSEPTRRAAAGCASASSCFVTSTLAAHAAPPPSAAATPAAGADAAAAAAAGDGAADSFRRLAGRAPSASPPVGEAEEAKEEEDKGSIPASVLAYCKRMGMWLVVSAAGNVLNQGAAVMLFLWNEKW